MPIPNLSTRHFAENNLRVLETHPEYHRLSSAIRHALIRSRWENPLKEAAEHQKRQLRENHPHFYKIIKRFTSMIKFW